MKQNLFNTELLLEQAETGINDRDQTLLQLEELLQNTTDRFAQKMEEERHRLETNQSVGFQVKPLLKDVQQQADFVKNIRGTTSDCTKREDYPTSSRFFGFDQNSGIN